MKLTHIGESAFVSPVILGDQLRRERFCLGGRSFQEWFKADHTSVLKTNLLTTSAEKGPGLC